MVPKGNLIQSAASSGLQVGDFVFLSAADALDEKGNPVGSTFRERVMFCLKKIQDVLSDASGELDSLVQLRVYYSAAEPIPVSVLEDILLEVMEEPLPALSLIPAGAVMGEVMIDGTAVVLSSPVSSCGGCSRCGRKL